MGQEQTKGWRRPTRDDYNWPADATDAEIEEALKAARFVRTEPPPVQNVGELLSKATQSYHPSTIKEGLTQLVTDPVGAVRGMAQLPLDLAGEAASEFGQGNYARSGRKAFEATLPFVGAAAGGMVGGPAGIIPGYMTGAGVASGSDAATGYAEQGLPYSAAGAAVDAFGQGLTGVRSMAPRTAPNAAAIAASKDRSVGNMMARTIGPTVGPNRYAWGNEARRIGQDILRKTTGGSVDDIGLEINSFKERSNAGLDAAYDMPVPVAGAPAGPAGQGRLRMPTAAVSQALQDRIDGLSSIWRNGRWEPYDGNAAVVRQLQRAKAELERQPATLDAKTIRGLRKSWDKQAEYENVRESTVGWHRLQPQGEAYRIARDVLNDQTVATYPHLAPHIADAALGIQADKLFKVLAETENARSRIARGSIAAIGGTMVGESLGGTVGQGIGAMAGPAVEHFLTQKVLPATKIKAARLMTQLSDELKAKGQSSKAITYAQELAKLTQPVGPTIRAAEALRNRPAAQPEPSIPTDTGSWFDTIMRSKGGG